VVGRGAAPALMARCGCGSSSWIMGGGGGGLRMEAERVNGLAVFCLRGGGLCVERGG